ncbi:zinc finger BED domain-containing protein 5-like [Diabrotica undecimpunctata]|uniref:zinc finger BED domain-containing protein 5-like n=1 Tax=Diabrotica undecimpunctata TaxID=50387 RepID=UPI003B63F8BB
MVIKRKNIKHVFLMETNFELRDRLLDELWLTTLAYLTDIFNRLNDLNLSLQGKSHNRFSVNDKINAFIKKCNMMKNSVSNKDLQSFTNLENFVVEHEMKIKGDLIFNIKQHCHMLIDSSKEYFDEDYAQFLWIRQPFILHSIPETLKQDEKESLVELSCDGGLSFQN